MIQRKHGAGVLVLAADTGRALFAQRALHVSEPASWAFWGGMLEPGETPRQAALRELNEETKYDGPIRQLSLIYVYRDQTKYDFTYYNYLLVVPAEFTPQLNWETVDAKWVELAETPYPRHYGVEKVFGDLAAMQAIKRAQATMKRRRRK